MNNFTLRPFLNILGSLLFWVLLIKSFLCNDFFWWLCKINTFSSRELTTITCSMMSFFTLFQVLQCFLGNKPSSVCRGAKRKIKALIVAVYNLFKHPLIYLSQVNLKYLISFLCSGDLKLIHKREKYSKKSIKSQELSDDSYKKL